MVRRSSWANNATSPGVIYMDYVCVCACVSVSVRLLCGEGCLLLLLFFILLRKVLLAGKPESDRDTGDESRSTA